MSRELDYILGKVRERRDYLETCVVEGAPQDFTAYKVKCAEIRMLGEVEEVIKDRYKQLQELNDE